MLYERIKKEHTRLQKQMKSIKKELKKLPAGKIIISHYGNYCKWYHRSENGKVIIKKQDRPFAEKLAAKKYLSYSLDDLVAKNRAVEFYLRHYKKCKNKAEKLLTDYPGYQELLSPYFQPLAQKHKEWMSEPYETNPNYKDSLNHKTLFGNAVRSKSEELIQLALHTNHIPFRYECALHLGAQVIYPDFMILHPVTSEVYYWEHFGRMHDPEYVKKAFAKLQNLALYGYVPFVNLIVTFETPDDPLSTEVVQKIIEHFFL